MTEAAYAGDDCLCPTPTGKHMVRISDVVKRRDGKITIKGVPRCQECGWAIWGIDIIREEEGIEDVL